MINKNNVEGKISIQTERVQKGQGCCFKIVGRTPEINSEERRRERSSEIIPNSMNDSKNLSTFTNKKKPIIKIAEPQQTMQFVSMKQIQKFQQGLNKALSSNSKSISLVGASQQNEAKQIRQSYREKSRKSINTLKATTICLKTLKSDKKQVSECESNPQQLNMEYLSPIRGNQIMLLNEKSIIQLPTARESISLNHLEKNQSSESLDINDRVFYSPLLRESITSEYESETETPAAEEIQQEQERSQFNICGLERLNMKRTQSISESSISIRSMSPVKGKHNRRTITFSGDALSEISDNHSLEEGTPRNFPVHFKRIVNFQDYFIRGGFIGAGRVSSVYRVQDKITRFVFALKEVFKKINEDENLRIKLNDSIRQHYLVSYHKSIVSLYSVFEDSGRYYFITELCEGNLRSKMKEPLSEDIAIKYLKSILKGLQILHFYKIIHGWLKPENVYICGQECKIGDFGWTNTLLRQNSIEVDWDYSSPQIIDKNQQVTERTDIWSLGVIAYEMVMGELPIINADKLEKLPSNISENYKQLLQGMLAKEPSQRMSISRALEIIDKNFSFQNSDMIPISEFP